MKLAIFGCSHTHGAPAISNGFNWPQAVAEQKTDWVIHNYALGSSGLPFQAALFKQVRTEYDKVIFQIPSAARLGYPYYGQLNATRYKKHFHAKGAHQVFLNYREIKRLPMDGTEGGVYSEYCAVTPGQFIGKSAFPRDWPGWDAPGEKYDFVRLWYENLDRMIENNTHEALSDWVYNRVDLCFTHITKDHLQHSPDVDIKIPSMVDIAPDAKKFIGDDGGHFTEEGHRWIANWVMSQIKDW